MSDAGADHQRVSAIARFAHGVERVDADEGLAAREQRHNPRRLQRNVERVLLLLICDESGRSSRVGVCIRDEKKESNALMVALINNDDPLRLERRWVFRVVFVELTPHPLGRIK